MVIIQNTGKKNPAIIKQVSLFWQWRDGQALNGIRNSEKFHSWHNSFCCINISKYYKNQNNKLQTLKLEKCEKNDYISTIMGIKMKVILHTFSYNILCPLGSICHQYQNEKSRIFLIIAKNCFWISNSHCFYIKRVKWVFCFLNCESCSQQCLQRSGLVSLSNMQMFILI